jgi:hypothetical protein
MSLNFTPTVNRNSLSTGCLDPLSRRALVLGDMGLWAAPDIVGRAAGSAPLEPDDDALERLLRLREGFKRPPLERAAAKWMTVVSAEAGPPGFVHLRDEATDSSGGVVLFRMLGTILDAFTATRETWRMLLSVSEWPELGPASNNPPDTGSSAEQRDAWVVQQRAASERGRAQ